MTARRCLRGSTNQTEQARTQGRDHALSRHILVVAVEHNIAAELLTSVTPMLSYKSDFAYITFCALFQHGV
jgi:hypothetical protein